MGAGGAGAADTAVPKRVSVRPRLPGPEDGDQPPLPGSSTQDTLGQAPKEMHSTALITRTSPGWSELKMQPGCESMGV